MLPKRVCRFERFVVSSVKQTHIYAFYRPKQSYRVFNTWMGDPSKIILLEAVLETMRKENLLHRVTTVGDYTLKQLASLQNEFSTTINSIRGRGTFIAFNCVSPELRDAVIKKLLSKGTQYLSRSKTLSFIYKWNSQRSTHVRGQKYNRDYRRTGIQAGGCGTAAIRLRPALTFTEQHANIFLDALRSILKQQ